MINDETQAFQFQTKDNYLKSTLLNDRFSSSLCYLLQFIYSNKYIQQERTNIFHILSDCELKSPLTHFLTDDEIS